MSHDAEVLRRSVPLPLAGAVALALSGCGLNVTSADLFLLHRNGPGGELTALVSDGGTIRCGTAAPKPLPDPLLLAARDLAVDLGQDAKTGLRVAARPGSVYTYTFKLTDGSVSFPDTAGRGHAEFGRAQLFAAQAAAICGVR